MIVNHSAGRVLVGGPAVVRMDPGLPGSTERMATGAGYVRRSAALPHRGR
jgi:hypothetical protein